MMKFLLTQLAILLGGIIISFGIGYFKGKNSQKTQELEENIKNAIESKKRQENRRNDDISAVKRRMQKYIRK